MLLRMARPSFARSFDVEYMPPALRYGMSFDVSTFNVKKFYGVSSPKLTSHPLHVPSLGMAIIEEFGAEVLVLVMRRGFKMSFDIIELKVLLVIFSMA